MKHSSFKTGRKQAGSVPHPPRRHADQAVPVHELGPTAPHRLRRAPPSPGNPAVATETGKEEAPGGRRGEEGGHRGGGTPVS